MNRTVVTAIALTLVAAFATAKLSVTQSVPDPELLQRIHDGKPIKAWLEDIIIKDDPMAALQIYSLADKVTPHLAAVLNTEDSLANEIRVHLWRRLPTTVRQHLDVPVLARDARMRALATIRDIGEPAHAAVPALIERLSDRNPEIRLNAAIALGNIGPLAVDAKPALISALADASPMMRSHTANAIWKISKDSKLVLPVLEELVALPDSQSRWVSAMFLGEMGPAAKSAIPLLVEAAKAPQLEVASVAIESLSLISPETVPFIGSFLEHPSRELRISAKAALERHRTPADVKL